MLFVESCHRATPIYIEFVKYRIFKLECKRTLIEVYYTIFKMSTKNIKTWVQIKSSAVARNLTIFRSLIGPKVKLWAVVKSNAYGHGLLIFSKLINEFGVDGFCVDSLIEGVKLRDNGVKKPILVLGPTLPGIFSDAKKKNITITISNFDALGKYLKSKEKPDFHLKIDTGMHRQGFYVGELPKVIKNCKLEIINSLKGV